MTFAFGEFGLVLLLAALTGVSAIRRQILALPVLLIGVGLFCFLAVTVFFQIGWPYEFTGISIYVVFFLAVIFSLAGGIGLVIRAFSRR